MQAIIAIPELKVLEQYGGVEHAILREICGIPVLARVINTAIRAGVKSIVVLWPDEVPFSAWAKCQSSLSLQGMTVITHVTAEPFQKELSPNWEEIEFLLDDQFICLPWNFVTHKYALKALPALNSMPGNWNQPALLSKDAVKDETPSAKYEVEGVSITSIRSVNEAERLLVLRSGKPLDGIYSTFNRALCRPAVRFLSHTSVTPNAITLGGLVVAIAAALLYTRGTYFAYLAGALLFFLSGLFDEMDGMIARIKFKESAFGTWFEGTVDNVTYLLIFAGLTYGLYQQYGFQELVYGAALIAGCILSVVVISLQRKKSTAADRPNEYLGNMYKLMDRDSGNLISRAVRHIHVFLKKGVAIHYLLLFTFIGALPIFLRVAAFASNITWIFALYLGFRFFGAPNTRRRTA